MESFAQLEFNYVQGFPVFHDGVRLEHPFAGGLNAGQYGTVDLNLDGINDLVVFDRSADKLNTFLNTGSAYEYAPNYEHFFPTDIRNWIVFADYNCDGAKDIFAHTNLGIKVYTNVSTSNVPSWELAVDPLLSLGTTSLVNLFLNATDVPAIADLDGDGDLDILVYNFAVGAFIEHHQNFSVERTGNCGALDFERVNRNFGGVEECTCNEFAFAGEECGSTGRQKHSGGKTILALDKDGDGDQDIAIGQELCEDIYFLENKGNATNALFDEFTDVFPSSVSPINFVTFPAPYFEDFDFDGIKDLVVAPNLRSNPGNTIDLQHSSWFYKNTGSNTNLQFELREKNFLQGEMIDVGDFAYPTLADLDGDGDLDMIIGSIGAQHSDGFYATLTVYRNTGTALERLDTDYLNLGSLKYTFIRPGFADMDMDGRLDLIFTGLNESNEYGYFYLPNSDSGPFDFDITEAQSIPFFLSPSDDPLIYDVDLDGLPDILLGRSNGRLEYHRNIGTTGNPSYQLENEAFLGIDFSSANGSLSIAVSDVDKDDKDDLITTDRSGVLKVYSDFLADNVPTPLETLVFNPLVNLRQQTVFDRLTKPVVGDLFGNGTRVLVIGSVQGGVRLLSSGDNTPGTNELNLTVFPNPSKSDKVVKFLSSNTNAQLELFEVSGKRMYGPVALESNVPLQVDLLQYNNGLYFARIKGNSNTKTVKFLLGNASSGL